MFNSTPATTSGGQFCCSVVVLVSVPLPPHWQNFGSGNLCGLKITLQRKKDSKQNKQTKNHPNKPQFSFLICFSLWPAPSPWIIVPAQLIRVVWAGKESAFQLILPARKAVSATLVWVCGLRSWSEAICQRSAAGRGVFLLPLVDSPTNQSDREDWWLGGEVAEGCLLWVMGVFLATSRVKSKCRKKVYWAFVTVMKKTKRYLNTHTYAPSSPLQI